MLHRNTAREDWPSQTTHLPIRPTHPNQRTLVLVVLVVIVSLPKYAGRGGSGTLPFPATPPGAGKPVGNVADGGTSGLPGGICGPLGCTGVLTSLSQRRTGFRG